MANKMTYAVALDVAIKAVADKEVAEKLEALKTSLAKKSKNGERKPSKTQLENKALAEAIFSKLVVGEKHTVSELIKQIDEISELSTQKVTPILKTLVNEGRVVKSTEKGKNFYERVEG